MPPPILPPKPGQVKVFRAIYTYSAQAQDELSFDAGDLLYVLDFSTKDWYRARCGATEGLIPSNYVEEQMEAVQQPMHSACQYGNVSFLEDLIANKISVNGLDAAGNTPLHWASRGGHIDCVDILLKTGCDVNVQSKTGDTALHLSAWKGHSSIVESLLSVHADPRLKNNQGQTAEQLTMSAECRALLKRAIGRSSSNQISVEDYEDSEEDEG